MGQVKCRWIELLLYAAAKNTREMFFGRLLSLGHAMPTGGLCVQELVSGHHAGRVQVLLAHVHYIITQGSVDDSSVLWIRRYVDRCSDEVFAPTQPQQVGMEVCLCDPAICLACGRRWEASIVDSELFRSILGCECLKSRMGLWPLPLNHGGPLFGERGGKPRCALTCCSLRR